ncbi:MAG: NAD-dependent epimerase/dehydratase family protein, partial [Promethearchaeota archaeon]
GSNLIRFLIEKRGVKPSDLRIFYLENTSNLAIDDLPELELYPGNILDLDSVKSACENMDLIYHTVGNTSFEPRNRKIQWLVNVEGTRNLLAAVKNREEIEKICYTSTVNTLGCPDPKGSLGTLDTSSPYENEPRLHSFHSKEEILEFADAVHQGYAPKKWWKEIGIGYYDSKLAAQELINRAVEKEHLNIVSVLPGTFFGPHDVFIGNGMYLIRVYNNAMPGGIKGGGLPLCHVEDVVRGHVLAMEKGSPGERYIITGREEDNLYMTEMLKVIADVIQEREPDKKIKTKFIKIPLFLAKMGASIAEPILRIFKKPIVISKHIVRAGSYPSFYSYQKAHQDLGYSPQKTFRNAVEDMYEYYKRHDYFNKTQREVDKF